MGRGTVSLVSYMLFRKLKKAVLKKRKREEERRPDQDQELKAVPFPSGGGGEDEDEAPAPPPPKKSKKRRCAVCRKKMTLAEGVDCKCGMHRYTDKHECAHDFKSADRAILSKNNQRCV